MKYLVLKIVAQRGYDASLKKRVLLRAKGYEHSRAEALGQRASAICGLRAESFRVSARILSRFARPRNWRVWKPRFWKVQSRNFSGLKNIAGDVPGLRGS